MLAEGRVGPRRSADGSPVEVRQGKDGEVVVQFAHGINAERVSRGKCYTAATAVTGVAHGTALSTTTPFGLWNPQLSETNLHIFAAGMAYVSGTLGAGTVLYCGQAQATTPTGTAISPFPLKLGAGTVGVGVPKTSMVTTTAPVQIRPGWSYGPILATTAVPPWMCRDWLEDEFVLQPGNMIGLQGLGTAGTSPLVIFWMSWEEVPA